MTHIESCMSQQTKSRNTSIKTRYVLTDGRIYASMKSRLQRISLFSETIKDRSLHMEKVPLSIRIVLYDYRKEIQKRSPGY